MDHQIITTNISNNVIDATTVTDLESGTEYFNCLQESGSFIMYEQNPRKKRSKSNKIGNEPGVSKPRLSKKPDPFAPKITAPCAVCGRKFWSWKALFGHMRCHPERQWRGINPPPATDSGGDGLIMRRKKLICGGEASTSSTFISTVSDIHHSKMTEEEHSVAASLLLLADGTARPSVSYDDAIRSPHGDMTGAISSSSCGCFECLSCKKIFGSHQALGGHRASHRNVKGCFQNDNDDEVNHVLIRHDHRRRINDDYLVWEELISESCPNNLHECSICNKVFSSGQALGGHKRCHWEKGRSGSASASIPASESLAPIPFSSARATNKMLDLNMPASILDDISSCSYSSPVGLDLRLGL